ncbi:flagellar hook-associated protein FlgL [Thiomicrorhabdus immobilis]|uniref:Flagellar hook-associated protein FlgL n=1 Tax=Thiomicrorhabdus immobilis TaxID=2791037 RepID=A0ABM7MC62_9GAMM|nr:flagellar hook-associated protein FlgL [Thiomicrorhabdus immobilis]BCN92973.1 flagellar hook-associated protein FlgL [Thiomicrorhabdus immobilis]
MRISTNLFHSQGLQSIQKHQQDVLDAQLKLSTGKRINAPGDDPVALNQIHSLNRTMNSIDQYAMNGVFAKAQLVFEETAIADTTDSLQRARELTIQMLNGTYTAEDRQATGKEIEQIILQVQNMMNYRNSEGELIFAGSSVNAEKAFVEDVNNPGYYAYIGSPNAAGQFESDGVTPVEDPLANYGSRFVQIGFDDDNKLKPNDEGDSSRVRISDNGQKVFGISTTTTFTGTPDQNILNVLVELKNALNAGLEPPAGVAEDLKAGIEQLAEVRAEIGGRQNRIQTQFDAGESFKIALEERRMGLEDMDIVEGVTELTKSQNALQMAQQVFSRVQDMSLFNYLR